MRRPCATTTAVRHEAVSVSHAITEVANLYMVEIFFSKRSTAAEAAVGGSKAGLRMVKVLIVEDAPFIREMIRDILESHDHEIVGEAANGLEAIEKYKALKPDIVLMDILMPGMDGLSAITKIIEQDPKARIIVVSALVKEALRKEAMRAGAMDFVAKPFQVERLLEAVRAASSA
jgi:two-component system chemotaxis response regulator CheY